MNAFAHHMVFTTWHRWQNTIVPFQYECIEYEADFARMRAMYSMSQEEFILWINNHEWSLLPGSVVFEDGYDYQDLAWIANALGAAWSKDDFRKLDQYGDQVSESSYASQMTESGRQLRAYYVDGRAFISYNAH